MRVLYPMARNKPATSSCIWSQESLFSRSWRKSMARCSVSWNFDLILRRLFVWIGRQRLRFPRRGIDQFEDFNCSGFGRAEYRSYGSERIFGTCRQPITSEACSPGHSTRVPEFHILFRVINILTDHGAQMINPFAWIVRQDRFALDEIAQKARTCPVFMES